VTLESENVGSTLSAYYQVSLVVVGTVWPAGLSSTVSTLQ